MHPRVWSKSLHCSSWKAVFYTNGNFVTLRWKEFGSQTCFVNLSTSGSFSGPHLHVYKWERCPLSQRRCEGGNEIIRKKISAKGLMPVVGSFPSPICKAPSLPRLRPHAALNPLSHSSPEWFSVTNPISRWENWGSTGRRVSPKVVEPRFKACATNLPMVLDSESLTTAPATHPGLGFKQSKLSSTPAFLFYSFGFIHFVSFIWFDFLLFFNPHT